MSTPSGRVLRHQRPVGITPNTRFGLTKSVSGSGTPVHVHGGTVMTGLGVGGSNHINNTVPSTSTPTPSPSTQSNTPQPSNIPQHLIPPASLPVYTPNNAPNLYQSTVYQRNQTQQFLGSGMRGVDWIVRISMALQCGIESELSWSLKALLEVSVRQPELIQFKSNTSIPLLLFDKIARSNIFATPVDSSGDGAVEGDVQVPSQVPSRRPSQRLSLSPTPIASSNQPLEVPDLTNPFYGSSPSDFFQLHKTIEALLILRNASLDPENAYFLANSPFCNEIILRGLQFLISNPQQDPKKPNLSNSSNPAIEEISSYCIDIAEAISFHMTPDSPSNPLFTTICKIAQTSTDRSVLIPTLRCLSRLMIRDDKNIIGSISLSAVSRIMKFLLVIEDEELATASLDFLYQYTARRPNVGKLLSPSAKNINDFHLNQEIISIHLPRLLTYKIEPPPKPDYIRLPRKTKEPVPAEPPKLPASILGELYAMEEPDRATHWIRTCYVDEKNGEVTQISLWKAYESQFEAFAKESGRRLLPAVDFIKNVTSAFRTSSAMVVQLPENQKKFIIKGIQPREYPIAPSVLNAPKPAANETANTIATTAKEPSAVSVSSALVLQNIARTQLGNQLLRFKISQFVESATLNPALATYIDGLLDIIDRTEHEEEEEHK